MQMKELRQESCAGICIQMFPRMIVRLRMIVDNASSHVTLDAVMILHPTTGHVKQSA